jgi:streptogramin lyase
LAGQPGAPGSADGAASEARFQSPGGIAVDNKGNAYVADTGNNTIRKIAPNGSVSTLAGQAGLSGDSDGSRNAARLMAPFGIAVDRAGNVYVAEFASDLIRKITPEGEVSTLAGSAGNPGSQDGLGDNAHFRNPWSVAVDLSSNVYVADRDNFTIRKITPTGRVSTFAGVAQTPGSTNGPGTYARFRDPRSIAVDLFGNVYVADTGNDAIRLINPYGMVSTLVGAHFSNMQNVAAGDPRFNVYVQDADSIRKIAPDGSVTMLPNSSLTDAHGHVIHPTSMAVDQKGSLYLVEEMNNVIWKATPPRGSRPK